MTTGTVLLKLVAIRFSRWSLRFDIDNHRQTTTQVWIRIENLSLEYRKTLNVFNVARGGEILYKIDSLTLNLYQGLYAIVVVQIDFTRTLR